MAKIGLISLGCPKNQVDAEMMLARLAEAGFEITNNPEGADIVIVNTCGFIEDAKKEAIDNILDMIAVKNEGKLKHIIVAGCLAERYKEEVAKEFPEVDAVVGIGATGDIAAICNKVLENGIFTSFPSKDCLAMDGARILTTPSHWAYLKIADGCSNRCSYCAIPEIRGEYRSRRMEYILDEAEALEKSGVKEVVIIAQDTTRYGEDLYGEQKLPELLKEIAKLDFKRIRLYYCYPDRLSDELIATIKENEKILNYIDLPLQHASGKVLRDMNRKGDRQSLTKLLKKIKSEIPGVVFRTTFIVGFPGESEEDFTELCEFCEDIEFDRMGAFAYSPEENTPAAAMENQIDERIKARRLEVLMNSQYNITIKKNKNHIGKTFEVMTDYYDEELSMYFGRSYMDAPEIDTGVYFTCEKELSAGDIVNVLIEGYEEYDLIGKEV